MLTVVVHVYHQFQSQWPRADCFGPPNLLKTSLSPGRLLRWQSRVWKAPSWNGALSPCSKIYRGISMWRRLEKSRFLLFDPWPACAFCQASRSYQRDRKPRDARKTLESPDVGSQCRTDPGDKSK